MSGIKEFLLYLKVKYVEEGAAILIETAMYDWEIERFCSTNRYKVENYNDELLIISKKEY